MTSKSKGGDDNLKQTKMGDCFSKNAKKTGEKKRKVKSPTASMWSSFWSRGAYRDTEEYRNRYPGKKDHENWNDNYEFYMNQIPSKPDGDFIDNIHTNWFGDHEWLERHHGYIQWLFPIRDTGMNWHAQELQLHEIEKLTKSRKAKKRILMSYKMMLDFYGMSLKNESTGEIERAENWKPRFKHLNRSYHNYLRITRILKSLGEFDFEHLKANFVRFVLYEGMVEYTLDNLIDSCVKYWIGVLRSDEERENVLDYYEELLEKQKAEDGKAKKRTSSASPEPTIKVKTGPSRYVHKYDTDSDPEQDADMEQYKDMDLLADTLPFENDLDSEDGEEKENADAKNTDPSAKKKGNVRVIHSMSDSDTDDFQTPDAESQEASYWASKNKAIDGTEDDDTERNREIREFMLGDTDINGDGDKKHKNNSTDAKAVMNAGGNNADRKEQIKCRNTETSVTEDKYSDEVDDVISTKDTNVAKPKSDNSCNNDPKVVSKEACDIESKKEDAKGTAKDEEDKNKTNKSPSANRNDSLEETPMETDDDGNVNVL